MEILKIIAGIAGILGVIGVYVYALMKSAERPSHLSD